MSGIRFDPTEVGAAMGIEKAGDTPSGRVAELRKEGQHFNFFCCLELLDGVGVSGGKIAMEGGDRDLQSSRKTLS